MNRLVNNPIRRFDFVQKLEWFLLTAITTILVIRTQLWLTNYPQLGGNGLHIAHLLWGGLFMMIAIWLSLIYLNRWGRTATALIGGVGFGFFIDELGKFITSDNNYFFKPAAGLIYIIFIIMFLVIRDLSRKQDLNPRAALANALSFLPSTVTGEFRRDDYERAQKLLDQSDPDDPLVGHTRDYLEKVTIAPPRPPSRLTQILDRVHARITALTLRPRFGGTVIAIVIAWGTISLLGILDIELDLGVTDPNASAAPHQSIDFLTVARSISILVSVLFVAVGVIRMRRGDHLAAYSSFGKALLVSIFVTRVFSFIESQFGAVFGLAIDIILFAAVSELASQDSQKKNHFAGLGDPELGGTEEDPDQTPA